MKRPVRMVPLPVYRLIRSLVAIVEDATRVGTREIVAPCGPRRVARARHIVFWAARRHGIGAERIAASLDRHHTTVTHGCRVVDRTRAADPAFRQLTDRVYEESRGDLREAA